VCKWLYHVLNTFLLIYAQEWYCWIVWWFYFSFFRDAIALHSSYTNLHSHQRYNSILFQYLLLFVLLVIAILTGMRWNLNVVLICISFIAKDVQYFFICFICTSFENCLFSSFAHLFSGLFILSEVSFLSSLDILVIISFSDV
jgi:hypothetical protein